MNKLLKASLICITSSLLFTASLPTYASSKNYSSAEIYSADTWLYGKYVFRMKVAEGSGILSNFFLWKPDSELSTVDWEEVDIEVFGKNGATSWQSNIISSGTGWTTSEEVHQHAESFADDYHTFSLEWTPDYVAWYVDGVELRRTEGGQVDLLKNPASLRFNFWASESVGWVGAFDDAILPANMYVNWVEFYTWNGESFDFDWRDDFNTFDTSRWSEAAWTFDGNYADFVPENSNVSDGYLVMSLTKSGEEGFSGVVPLDSADSADTPDDQEVVDEVIVDNEEVVNEEPPVAIEEGNLVGATCVYSVGSEWDTGFVGNITITNNSDSPINAWSLSWEYTDGSTVDSVWNATLSDSAPYTAKNLSWNGNIAKGDSVSFGFSGVKGASAAEIATITSDICQ